MKEIDLDSIWRELGSWGRFQMFQALLVSYNVIPACFTILTAVFTGYVPDHLCEEVSNGDNTTGGITYEYGKCSIKSFKTAANVSEFLSKDTCSNGYKYSVPVHATYTAEWNLVCSRSNFPPLAQSLVLAGQGVGAFFMSHLSDRFGRKTIQVLSSIGLLVSAIVIAVTPNIIMLLVMRLIAGTFQQGVICSGATLHLEMFAREKRAFFNCVVFGHSWTAGVMLLALFGYLFQDLSWRHLQLALAAWSLISLGEWWLLEESLRWLLVNGRIKQAKAFLKKAAGWNRVDYNKLESILMKTMKEYDDQLYAPNSKKHDDVLKERLPNIDPDDARPSLEKEHAERTSNRDVIRYSFLDIVKDSKLRLNTFILWYAWLTVASTYYGLTLISTHLAGNRFLNFFLSGLFEVPSGFVMWLLCDKGYTAFGCFYLFRLGRKKAIVVLYAVTGCCLIIATGLLTKLAHVQAVSITATGLSLIGKTAISAAFGTMFLYTPEIYPTNYRNRGLGIASSLSRIGAMLSPFASNLALIALWIPAAIFGGMCLLVAVLALRLPESKHFQLPQFLQEFQEWSAHEETQTNQKDDSHPASNQTNL